MICKEQATTFIFFLQICSLFRIIFFPPSRTVNITDLKCWMNYFQVMLNYIYNANISVLNMTRILYDKIWMSKRNKCSIHFSNLWIHSPIFFIIYDLIKNKIIILIKLKTKFQGHFKLLPNTFIIDITANFLMLNKE